MKQKIQKLEALKIIYEAANLYNINLNNKNILILTKNEKQCSYYEFRFKPENFLHFTGLILNKNISNGKKITANDFFYRAINNKLSINDFEYKDEFTTLKKLSVLKDAMKLHNSAKMIGNFLGKGAKIKADIGSGNTSVVMTFNILNKSNQGYPVSVLAEDVRDVTNPTNPVIAILFKDIKEKRYNIISYKSKNINIDKLNFPKEIRELLTEKALYELKPSLESKTQNIEQSNNKDNKIIEGLTFEEVVSSSVEVEQNAKDILINEVAISEEKASIDIDKLSLAERIANANERKKELEQQRNSKEQNKLKYKER